MEKTRNFGILVDFARFENIVILQKRRPVVSMAAVEDSLQGSSDKENHEKSTICLGFSITNQ